MSDEQRIEDELLSHIGAHRSIRKFKPVELSDADARRAVEAAQMAATSSNIQAYSLLRVRDAERRAQLAELCGGQPYVAEAGAFFVVCGDLRRHLLVAEDQGLPNEQNLECFLLAAVDASLFAQNLVLAFEAMGLGICYIGGLRNRLPEVDALLELPAGVLPLYGLCVGVPDQEPGQRPRLRHEAVLFEERYPSDDEMRAHIAEYDERMRSYYEQRGKPGYDWSGGLARRFRKKTREHLAAFYRDKGARLD
jgi:FMN reductase (NADPH)